MGMTLIEKLEAVLQNLERNLAYWQGQAEEHEEAMAAALREANKSAKSMEFVREQLEELRK